MIDNDRLKIHQRVGCEPKGSPKEYHLLYDTTPEGVAPDPIYIHSIMYGTQKECSKVKEFISLSHNPDWIFAHER